MTAMKKQQRLRRARRARFKMRERGMVRLCVNRTPRHIYAQILSPDGSSVLASASTLDKELRVQEGGKKEAAASGGKLVAERDQAAGVNRVDFDRSGFKYQGRVTALADAARDVVLEM